MFVDTPYPVKLNVFEGPLDLLLFLIRRQEIDIYDIPIRQITAQYMEVLGQLEEIQPEIAGEFFVMAATLMEIKSRLLLPRQKRVEETEEEEEIDPRWELVHQLLEYQKFKKVSFDLREKAEAQLAFAPRRVPPTRPFTPQERPLRQSDKMELWNAFNEVLRRLSEKLATGEIHDEVVTVADRMEYLLDESIRRGNFLFSDLFAGESKLSVRKLVATFLALLELVRLKKLRVRQTQSFDDISCEIREDH